ncbi:MAG: glycosyltransferase family 2 protein [Muribaculaceae bacterium]|nr:glycosyltransferase family 2 protein [Muribaculaceae bacterium]
MMEGTDHYKDCMSIIIPVYNRPNLVERCLDSVKAQTYRPIHIIVVDNGSTDDTFSHVKKWKESNSDDNLTLEILSDMRHGAAYARETGLHYVDTEKVMFFDSDDYMRPDCVSSIMKVWRDDPSIDVVAWPVAFHYGKRIEISHSITGNLLERHLVHSIFRTLGYAIKTDFLREAGGWRGEFPNWNDLETGSRVLMLNPKVKSFRKPMMDVYPQSESITGLSFSSKAGKWEKSLDGIDMSIDASGRSDAGRLHNIVTYRRAILAADYAKEGHMELAEPLYHKALAEIDKKKRPLIRIAYNLTKRGMSGAFSIIGKML